MDSKISRVVVGALIAFASFSCATNPADKVNYSKEPIGMQLVRAEPSLKGRRFNTLLDFESPTDLVFVSAHPPAQIDSQHAHTGKQSANIGQTAKFNISAISSAAFPGEWALLGAYLWSDRPATVNLRCTEGSAESQRSIDLPGRQWTPAFVDLTQFIGSNGGGGDVSLTISATVPLICDDLMLMQNDLTFLTDQAGGSEWSIHQHGYKIIGLRPGSFSFTLDSADGSPNGWHIDEVSPLRARFSSTGATKQLTIYPDGRAYWDGQFKPLAADMQSDPMYLGEHNSPGEAHVTEGMGRVNRSSPGDANNDGYNEILGAYELVANGPRIEFTLAPTSAPLLRPIVEIAGLPKGKPLVNIEGRLVESAGWLADGHLLINIPARIERPTSINVRIE